MTRPPGGWRRTRGTWRSWRSRSSPVCAKPSSRRRRRAVTGCGPRRGVPGRGARLRDERQRSQRRDPHRHGRNITGRLLATLAGMEAGLIDRDRARAISNATLHLPDEKAAIADKILAEAATEMRLADLYQKAGRLQARLDPEGVKARKEETKRDRRVELRREISGALARRPGTGPRGGDEREGVDRRGSCPAPQRGPARDPGPDPRDDLDGPHPPAQLLGPPRPATPRRPRPEASRRPSTPTADPTRDDPDDDTRTCGGTANPATLRETTQALHRDGDAGPGHPERDDADDNDADDEKKRKMRAVPAGSAAGRRPDHPATGPAARPRCPR